MLVYIYLVGIEFIYVLRLMLIELEIDFEGLVNLFLWHVSWNGGIVVYGVDRPNVEKRCLLIGCWWTQNCHPLASRVRKCR
jgi:hypothetical protein